MAQQNPSDIALLVSHHPNLLVGLAGRPTPLTLEPGTSNPQPYFLSFQLSISIATIQTIRPI